MVAASKLRRAQEKITSARPYAVQMQHVLAGLAGRVDESIHPLLAARETGPDSRTLIIVVTSDKGLCGSFNTNLNKAASQLAVKSSAPVVFGLVGRKGRDYFGRRGFKVEFEQVGIFQKLAFSNAQTIATLAMDAFTSGRADRVLLVYNEFKSVMSQKVVVDQLLPIAHTDTAGNGPVVDDGQVEYLFEPTAQEIFNQLLPRYIGVQIYRALLESTASEQGARMTAMRNASKNAGEIIDTLTLRMNRARQAEITQEILEVVGGAEALT